MAREIAYLATPVATAGGHVIVSPFQFLVTGEDHLRIEGWTSVNDVSLEVSYRFADLAGAIVANRVTFALTADRLKNERNVVLGNGYLVNLAVLAVGGAPRIGQTFICVKLIRGFTGAIITIGLLAQGYVTSEQGLGWPGSPIADSVGSGGALRFLEGTDPPAGQEQAETVPTGARWELQMWRGALITSATVAARRPSLRFDDGTVFYFTSPNPGTSPASTAIDYYWAPGMPHTSVITVAHQLAGLPQPMILLAGHRIVTVTEALQAGDDWNRPRYTVREWLEAV